MYHHVAPSLKANVPPTQLDSSPKVQIRQYRCLQLILDGPVVRNLKVSASADDQLDSCGRLLNMNQSDAPYANVMA